MKACFVVEGDAKKRCPIGQSGHLRDSIQSRVEGNTGIIGTNAFYAPYVEFGTGSYARDGDGRAGYWVYVKNSPSGESKKARKIYTYEQACWIADRLREEGLDPVITKGQKPQPFLQPALLENRKRINEVFKNEILRQLKGAK